LSDLSDEDDNLYPDEEFGEEMKLIRLNPTPTTNARIRRLYSNTDKVFQSHLISSTEKISYKFQNIYIFYLYNLV